MGKLSVEKITIMVIKEGCKQKTVDEAEQATGLSEVKFNIKVVVNGPGCELKTLSRKIIESIGEIEI